MSMANDSEFDLDLDELSSAEDFLSYFEIPFDPSVVHVNRLHIMQRFHDYLSQQPEPETDNERAALYQRLLARAYQDFVVSDAVTEKVFKVFQRQGPQETFVSLDSLNLNLQNG